MEFYQFAGCAFSLCCIPPPPEGKNTFYKILAKAGLRKIRFHDIRHTFASLLLSQGESPVYVKEQLGHYSIQMTVDVYGHLIPGSNRGAVNKLDKRATIRNLSATNEKRGNHRSG